MVTLELLNEKNEKHLLRLRRDDVPKRYVEDVEETIALTKYGKEHNLKGCCFAIKHGETYVGIILLGEAIEGAEDPDELKGKPFFRILGFLVDSRYRGRGIGSTALKMAMEAIHARYGKVPFLLESHKDNQKAIRFYEKMGFVNTNQLNGGTDYFMIRR